MSRQCDETFLEGLETGVKLQTEKIVLNLVKCGVNDINKIADHACTSVEVVQEILDENNV